MTRVLLIVAMVLAIGQLVPGRAIGGGCDTFISGNCGVNADHIHGDFHGLIALHGQPRVLDIAARSGTKPGCADCVWTLVTNCAASNPRNPGSDGECPGSTHSQFCRRGVLERLYLSDDAEAYAFVTLVCIHRNDHIVPVGDTARADVARYLKNVTPPDLRLTTSPRRATLAGLATYFTSTTPNSLKPAPFGGPEVHETITLTPKLADWLWGDGSGSGWITALSTQTHRYVKGGTARGQVMTRWGATYTITFDGTTFGPYDAVGQITKTQRFTLPVDTSSPTLVSH